MVTALARPGVAVAAAPAPEVTAATQVAGGGPAIARAIVRTATVSTGVAARPAPAVALALVRTPTTAALPPDTGGPVMPSPTPSWDLVRVYGRWRGMNGALKAGTYKVSIPVRVTNATDDAIIPAGVYDSGTLGSGSGWSLDVMVPATDDPDTTAPQAWKVEIEVLFTDAPGEKYRIEVPYANRPSVSGGNGQGVNLRTITLS